VADIVWPAQEATSVRRKKRNPGVLMGGHSITEPRSTACTGKIVSRKLESPPCQSKRCNGPACDDRSTIRGSSGHCLERGAQNLQPCLATDVSGSGAVTPAAMPCLGAGGAENAMRAQAVAATVIAPANAIACCQPLDGTAMYAIPRAA
jgi:hypothetical protein